MYVRSRSRFRISKADKLWYFLTNTITFLWAHIPIYFTILRCCTTFQEGESTHGGLPGMSDRVGMDSFPSGIIASRTHSRTVLSYGGRSRSGQIPGFYTRSHPVVCSTLVQCDYEADHVVDIRNPLPYCQIGIYVLCNRMIGDKKTSIRLKLEK